MFTQFLTASIASIVERMQRSVVTVYCGTHGVGAGIVWGLNGLIVTNFHVIAQGSVEVCLPDGREHNARILAKAPDIDLAMLQIDEQTAPVVEIASRHQIRVGQLVLAIGHPWGQRGAVTMGVISGLGTAKTRNGRGPVDIIRTDARLAPGNSGGPLALVDGSIIGVNTMIVGGDQGVAIPSHVINAFVAENLRQPII